jgi:sulfate transport system ATP-binding protein
VNVFQGRIERGRAVATGLDVAYPDYPHPEARETELYIRPHEFVIDRRQTVATSLAATVQHVNPTGSRIKVELQAAESGLLINAEITPERFDELGLRPGDLVYVSPRRVRAFVAD